MRGRWPWLFALVFCLGPAADGSAQGPVRDPFYVSFVLGHYRDPGSVSLRQSYPADLWLPAEVDSSWVRSASLLLDPQVCFPDPQPLLPRWLGFDLPPPGLSEWAESRRSMVRNLAGEATAPDAALHPPGPMLDAMRTLVFFRALAQGDSLRALEIADSLAAGGGAGSDATAVRFIWDLRARALGKMTGVRLEDPLDPWPLLFELAPYDRQSGWAIWTAHRRELGLPLLDHRHRSRQQAAVLAGLGKSWLGISDLEHSGFDFETKAGLGAAVLKGAARRKFMSRYRHPPWDFQAQGWWLKGARAAARGQPGRYESMGADPHLRSGWRMDLWRRASERRLLQGEWEQGLADLRQAVSLARYQAGSPVLRIRVRQWVEQALALAEARGQDARGAVLFELGEERLPGRQRETFCRRVAAWYDDAACAAGPDPGSVRAGEAEPLASAAASSPLPEPRLLRLAYWRRWADYRLGATDKPTLGALRAALEQAEDAAPARLLVMDHLASRLARTPTAADLWDRVLAQEVFLNRTDSGPAAWPLFPLLRKIVGKKPDLLQLWLGVALALQDLRTVVGLASLLPDDSLPSDEKLTFLYPLPAFGPVRRALEGARSEPALLLGVARNESLFDPGARSRAGAMGWMQIMPFHFGKDDGGGAVIWGDPSVSIAKGDALLEENRQRFKGDPYTVVAAYNAGPRAARRWWKQLGGTSTSALYLSWIGYPETRRYVEKVLKDRAIYAGILAADPGLRPAGRSEQ